MEATTFKKQTLYKRVGTMLKADSIRMFKTPLFYIMLGISFLMPILILVMTTMAGGTTVTDPSTGAETVMEGFTNTWQIVSALPGASSAGTELTGMCNMNMAYFIIAIFVCLFVGSEFKNGYSKNLFCTRANKTDYVISKTAICSIAGAVMIIAFFVGAMLGGAIAGLPFTTEGFNAGNIIACLLAKLFLVPIFVAIPLTASVFSKQKVWLSILIGLGAGMLLFMTIPIMTPLNATWQPFLCLVGSVMFAFGLGAVSNLILNKTDIA